MLRNYLVVAFRTLYRQKVYSFVNILGLTLGITCCIVIFTFLRYETSFDHFHQKADKTYRIVQHTKFANSEEHWNTTAYPLAAALRQDFPELEKVTQTAGIFSRVISTENEKGELVRFEEDQILFADALFPQVFDLEWIAGNPKTALDGPNSVVLTETLANKYYGDALKKNQSVLGRRMKLNDKDNLLVTGIIKDPPPNINQPFRMLVCYEFFRANNLYMAENWSGNYQGTTYVVLLEDYSPQRFEKQLVAFKKKYLSSEDNQRIAYYLQPLKEVHTETFYGSSPGGYVVPKVAIGALWVVALFILLIVAVNFVNLATAQAVKRSKEVGVRKVLGGSRPQLFGQFMGETAVLTTLAFSLSMLLTHHALEQINGWLSIIRLQLVMDRTIWIAALSISSLITLLAGFYPSVVLSGYQPISALKNRILASNREGLSLRRVLIVVQFSLALVLIISTIVITNQMIYFQSKNLGFNKDAIVTVSVPPDDLSKLEVWRNQLLQNSAIEQVSFASGIPTAGFGQFYGTTFRLKGAPDQAKGETEMKVVDLEYVKTFGLKVIAGTNLTETNRTKEGFNGFLVNEKLIEQLGLTPAEAIGKQLVINEGEAPIVGVVKDFHNNSLQEAITPCVLFYWDGFFEYANIKISTANGQVSQLAPALSFIESSWNRLFPNNFFHHEFVDGYLAKNYLVEDIMFKGIMLFSAIAIFISCLGLYGLVTFIAMQRTKEVGIRKVFGASVPSIVLLFSKEFVRLILIAFIIASPIAYYCMQNWLQDFTYHIQIGVEMFGLAVLVAFLVAGLSVGYQLIKAALANPVKSLKSE